jgi:hypothetical protein
MQAFITPFAHSQTIQKLHISAAGALKSYIRVGYGSLNFIEIRGDLRMPPRIGREDFILPHLTAEGDDYAIVVRDLKDGFH